MYRVLKADKDTYITNKYVGGIPVVSGNVGIAGTIDFFKLYGLTILSSGTTLYPQTELTRALLHFDIEPLRELYNQNKIDITHPSFKCELVLRDVYGGQTTPNNFVLDVFPLSASFDEGNGKDSAYYVDQDVANFISASTTSAWANKGCTKGGGATEICDYITSSATIPTTKVSQTFQTGEENLTVDVTKILSATLKGELPDSGFRVSFSNTIESNKNSYFVKRFASRHAYDESKHPKIVVKFDDSIQDDTSNLFLDSPVGSNLFLYNYVHNQLTNLLSASSEVTGSNCLLLELKTEASGVGNYSLFFTGSQYLLGNNQVSGIYSAPVSLPISNVNIKASLDQTGSVEFTPIWGSLDKTVTYVTGSKIVAHPPQRTNRILNTKKYTISVLGTRADYSEDEEATFRVNIFDSNDPIIKAKRLPVELPGVVLRNSYYAIRNSVTNEYVIPFDTQSNSTKLSSDSYGMYFNVNTSALTPLRSYVVDIMIVVGSEQQKYLNASQVFRVNKI